MSIESPLVAWVAEEAPSRPELFNGFGVRGFGVQPDGRVVLGGYDEETPSESTIPGMEGTPVTGSISFTGPGWQTESFLFTLGGPVLRVVADKRDIVEGPTVVSRTQQRDVIWLLRQSVRPHLLEKV